MERVRKLIHTQIPYSEGYFGTGSTVAILDTGMAMHADFKNRVLDFHDFVNGRSGMYDDNGHGTHLAGISAQAAAPGTENIWVWRRDAVMLY